MSITNRRRGGFTVTEIMISVVIIAVLAAILMPAIQALQKRVLAAKCINNLKQLGLAVSLYATENDGFLPSSYSLEQADSSGARNWYNKLQDGSGTLGSNQGVLPNANTLNARIGTVYQCPLNPTRVDLWRDPNYAYNRALGYIDVTAGVSIRVRMANIPSATKTLLLADGGLRKASKRAPELGPAQYLLDYDTFDRPCINHRPSMAWRSK